MATYRFKTFAFLLASIFAYIPTIAQTVAGNLIYHSSKGQNINVRNGTILVNGKDLYKLEEDGIIYSSKRNKIIENGGTVFLFLEVDGSPNLDRLYVFRISNTKVDSITNAISSDLMDLDGDNYLEFGGRDLTEIHPSEDSMYYISFDYYEIRNGNILYDSALTKERSIWVNGIYRTKFKRDGSDEVIIKPGVNNVKDVSLVNPPILHERIDGPANVRDTKNGKILFRLMDNVPIYSEDTVGNWSRIALEVDLSDFDFKSHSILKNQRLFLRGREIGLAVQNLRINDPSLEKENGNHVGVISGYTSNKNIKPNTVPENCLCQIIKQNSSLEVDKFKDLIKGFQFMERTLGKFKEYQLDNGLVDGPSSRFRLKLIFYNDRLFGIVHLRQLFCQELPLQKLERGYNFSTIGNQNPNLVKDFIKTFNSWIKLAD